MCKWETVRRRKGVLAIVFLFYLVITRVQMVGQITTAFLTFYCYTQTTHLQYLRDAAAALSPSRSVGCSQMVGLFHKLEIIFSQLSGHMLLRKYVNNGEVIPHCILSCEEYTNNLQMGKMEMGKLQSFACPWIFAAAGGKQDVK